MDEKTRIQKDIIMFEENLKKLGDTNKKLLEDPRITLASQYFEDAKYYLDKKKDYFTAFGCINYGHGLLDAILKF
ncbi:MAG: DUF357 domain-containing protein [Thermoplasmatota archaeon]